MKASYSTDIDQDIMGLADWANEVQALGIQGCLGGFESTEGSTRSACPHGDMVQLMTGNKKPAGADLGFHN